jgi:hypothetical protein
MFLLACQWEADIMCRRLHFRRSYVTCRPALARDIVGLPDTGILSGLDIPGMPVTGPGGPTLAHTGSRLVITAIAIMPVTGADKACMRGHRSRSLPFKAGGRVPANLHTINSARIR